MLGTPFATRGHEDKLFEPLLVGLPTSDPGTLSGSAGKGRGDCAMHGVVLVSRASLLLPWEMPAQLPSSLRAVHLFWRKGLGPLGSGLGQGGGPEAFQLEQAVRGVQEETGSRARTGVACGIQGLLLDAGQTKPASPDCGLWGLCVFSPGAQPCPSPQQPFLRGEPQAKSEMGAPVHRPH